MESNTVGGNGRNVEPILARVNGDNLEGGEAGLSPFIGRLIKGKYRVTGRLATWPLGTLFIAEQLGAGNRLVLKVFQGKFERHEEFAYRLRQQMLAVAAISETHRNIARIYDCDQAEDGSLFIAMEYLEGRTLRDLMGQEGALDIERAMSLAVQMAEGLCAVHDAGLVHTDLHPQNVMVVGEGETLKILGFERARLRNVAAMDHLTPSRGIPMTPEYVAPEQIRKGEITRQTDVYAFGVVLYEMLTGIVPFRASTPEGILAMHLQARPRSLRSLRPEIPLAVEAKVLQALEKDPKRRETLAGDVVNEALRELVFEKSGAEPPQGKQSSIRGRPSYHQADTDEVREFLTTTSRMGPRWKSVAIGALLILIAAAVVWTVYPGKTPEVDYQPSPQYRPQEVQVPAPENDTASAGVSPKRIAPPSAERGSIGVTSPEGTRNERKKLSERKKLAEKEYVPAPKQSAPRSSRSVRPPTPSQEGAADTQGEPQSPSDIIDWLFKQR